MDRSGGSLHGKHLSIAALSASRMSGLSVIGRTMLDLTATSRGRPARTSRPAWISMRVDAPSSRPWPCRLRGTFGDGDKRSGERSVGAGFARHDGGFDCRCGIIEIDREKPLLGGFLRSFTALWLAGIVRDRQLEIGVGGDDLVVLFQRQDASGVRQRMDDDGGVLPRLDDLVEIADRAVSGRPASAGRHARPCRSVREDSARPDPKRSCLRARPP